MDPNAEPSIFWVADVDDPFVPYPKQGLMLNVKEDRERIDAFLDKLITLYHVDSRKNLPIQTCSGAAMYACKNLLGQDGGRVMVFSTTICSKGAGMLKSRDKVTVYNTDEEKSLFLHTTEHEFYRELGHSSVKSRVTFDLYLGVP